jgi:hypothetical protein
VAMTETKTGTLMKAMTNPTTKAALLEANDSGTGTRVVEGSCFKARASWLEYAGNPSSLRHN